MIFPSCLLHKWVSWNAAKVTSGVVADDLRPCKVHFIWLRAIVSPLHRQPRRFLLYFTRRQVLHTWHWSRQSVAVFTKARHWILFCTCPAHALTRYTILAYSPYFEKLGGLWDQLALLFVRPPPQYYSFGVSWLFRFVCRPCRSSCQDFILMLSYDVRLNRFSLLPSSQILQRDSIHTEPAKSAVLEYARTHKCICTPECTGHAVAYLSEALCYNSEVGGFDSRKFTGYFSIDLILSVDSASSRNEYQESSWE
jgi:hypothetical protein